MKNYDKKTVKSFGDEWEDFDQSKLSNSESENLFNNYFKIFPWSKLAKNSVGYDMGCGSGRWAKFASSKVGHLHCIEPSSAINVAKKNLKGKKNITFHKSFIENVNIKKNSMDFGYCLGVLHHLPDTQKAIEKCVDFLKPNSPLLVYIYYSLDNRPYWVKIIWYFSNVLRFVISKLPRKLKNILADLIALFVYMPLSRFYILLKKFNIEAKNFPLSFYSNLSFYTIRTDSRDRFGTPLEKRFSKKEINIMMIKAGLKKIKFLNKAPYWVALGLKK